MNNLRFYFQANFSSHVIREIQAAISIDQIDSKCVAAYENIIHRKSYMLTNALIFIQLIDEDIMVKD